MRSLLLISLALAGHARAAVSLQETLIPSALHDLRQGDLRIRGTISSQEETTVKIRVTDPSGNSTLTEIKTTEGKFQCRFPSAFANAKALRPGLFAIDAIEAAEFDQSTQTEAAVLVHGGSQQVPDFPDLITNDLLDAQGNADAKSSQWQPVRKLANLYVQSRGAKLAGVKRPGFDLNRSEDLQWFKEQLSLYDFANRDRDWQTPLGARVARTFWQTASKNWFGPGNDHPLDGNANNKQHSNFLPYGFSNDHSDWMVLYWLRTKSAAPFLPNLRELSRDATRNMLALQHRQAGNFALEDSTGKRENYTAGAFRYGMFVNGEFLTESKGWFIQPEHKDYIWGGVFNGRSIWGLGEALRQDPKGPLAGEVKTAIQLGLKFCLHDGFAGDYTKQTAHGHRYWRNPGEHAYLLLGMLAACEVEPGLEVSLDPKTAPAKLKELCIEGIEALMDLKKPGDQWSPYPNEDPMVIAALAQGAAVLKGEPAATRWIEAASRGADGWLTAKVDPKERQAPCIQFGYRSTPQTMTHKYMKMGKVQIYYYITGHWIHALSELYAVTGTVRYKERVEALISDLCGNNPLRVRLLTETGGVYNWSDDNDGDGIEETIHQDIYSESTAFCQIGILRYLQTYP